jgi:hypothetical protein
MISRAYRSTIAAGVVAAGLALGSFGAALAAESAVSLSGSQEVPPVDTPAKASGSFNIAPDGAVRGSIKTSGITSTAAHIHVGGAGKNGPVIVPLAKQGDDTYVVPSGAKLNESQMASYKAGDLYVNVHSAKHPGGEIRAQLKP